MQEFKVVDSDYRMPEMSELGFLKAFAERQHDGVRIVLSGQTDMHRHAGHFSVVQRGAA